MCGENDYELTEEETEAGSPPRVRGKHAREARPEVHAGITPACAGKTSFLTAGRGSPEDHPRVCGENFLHVACDYLGRGSPPRVRGKPVPFLVTFAVKGITPACAGKTPHNR